MPTAAELERTWKARVGGPSARSETTLTALQRHTPPLYPMSPRGGGAKAVRGNPFDLTHYLYGYLGAESATMAAQASELYCSMVPGQVGRRCSFGQPHPVHKDEPQALTERLVEWVAAVNARSPVALHPNARHRILPGQTLLDGTALLIHEISQPKGEALYALMRACGFEIIVTIGGRTGPAVTVRYTELSGLVFADEFAPAQGSIIPLPAADLPLTYTVTAEIDHIKVLADLWRETCAKTKGTISNSRSATAPAISCPERESAEESPAREASAPSGHPPNNAKSRHAKDRGTHNTPDLSVCVRDYASPDGLVASSMALPNGDRDDRDSRRSRRVRLRNEIYA